MNRHVESFMTLEQLGERIPDYQPTFDFPRPFINKSHRFISGSARNGHLVQLTNRRWFGKIIQGWLRPEDALKLYELAYFISGDILELGSYHGLSTSILAWANDDSPRRKLIYSIDLDPEHVRIAEFNLRRAGRAQHVRISCADAVAALRRFMAEGRRFELVFVDHSHAYEPVHAVCRELGEVVAEGGFCLFHDYNDPRNRDSEDKEYGVFQAVQDGLSTDQFEFYGIYGCAALYRRKER